MSALKAGAQPTVAELLHAAADRLRAPELLSEDPHVEARELVAHALGLVPAQLQLQARLTAAQHEAFLRLFERRLASEPTGYLVGAVELMGLRFAVDRRGFIPRLDLPVLIRAGLERTPVDAKGRALDLACGIGAAGICVAKERPGLHVDVADVSAEAIELARENADRLTPGAVSCFVGSLFDALPPERKGQYLLITANPPWVPDDTELPSEVIDHEPRVSFFGGPDGLDLVRSIIRVLPEWLAAGGAYAQECDPTQVAKVQQLLREVGLVEVRAHADREGVERVVSAQRR